MFITYIKEFFKDFFIGLKKNLQAAKSRNNLVILLLHLLEKRGGAVEGFCP